MQRKITLYLFALFIFIVSGTVFATFYIKNVTADLNRLITLHEIEDLRQNLIMSIQTTQSDLYTFYTPLGHELDSIVSNVTNLDHAAQKCTTCHHPPELFNRLKEIQSLIEDYKTALSNYITASANTERIAMLKNNAAEIGGVLLTNTMEMSFQASNKLALMTNSTMSQLGNVRKIIYATILLTFLLGIIISIRLIKFITRPAGELVNATREIAEGNFGYKVSYKDRTEFGEIANNFNTMSIALKASYEKLQGKIVEHKQAEEEKKKLEDQLLHAQKMESVGRLAGGVAHDFNNILTAIIGYADLLQMDIKEDDPQRTYLEQILTASNQGANLTQSLLAFSRKQIIHPQPINLNGIVTRMEELLLRVIGEDIKLKTVLTDEDATIMVDSGQIEQVLMNLATCPNISNRFRCGYG
jgi:signal transduction histidine kinase